MKNAGIHDAFTIPGLKENTMMICGTLLTLVMLLATETKEPSWPEFTLECSQEELCIGGSLYALVKAYNSHDHPFYLSDGSSPVIKVNLIEPEIHYVHERFLPFEAAPWSTLHEINAHESRIMKLISIVVPPFEDLHSPNWQEFAKDIPPEGKKLTLEVTINASMADNHLGKDAKRQVFKLTHEFLVKPRSPEETALIERWYRETPVRFFPSVVKDRDGIPKHKIWTWGRPQYLIFDEQISEDEQKTEVWGGAGKKVFFNEQTPEEERKKLIVAFHRNRYPTYPNAPITWQGWKELEESLEPSTMRDEIRMTRICIQYLQTRDDSVFEELKEWLANMEEPQRTVMTYGVMMRATSCYGTNLLTPLGHVYHAIDEYYVPIDQTFLRKFKSLDMEEGQDNNH